MSHRRNIRPLWQSLAQALVLLMMFGLACDDPEQQQYENRLHRELDAFEFERPIGEVWPELLQVLGEDGYVLEQQTPVEGRTLETLPKRASYGKYRVLVRLLRRSQQRYRIQLELQFEDETGKKSIEPWNVDGGPIDRLKGNLIDRTEPERAAEMRDALMAREGSGCRYL